MTNVLILMADGWRRQASTYGGDAVPTPNLDALAAEGATFAHACTNHPLCTPARAAMLTGRFAQAIGMEYNWQRLAADEPNLASTLARRGYDTALIGKWHLDAHDPQDVQGNLWTPMTPPGDRRCGFRSWYSSSCNHDHFRLRYQDTAGDLHDLGPGWQCDHETDQAIAYLRNRDGQRPVGDPFFLWLNFSPPHNQCGGDRFDPRGDRHQYYAPEAWDEPFRERALVPRNPDTDPEGFARWAPGYFGCVASIDACLGRLLRTLDAERLSEDTLVVVTSDHGEMLGTHGRWIKDVWFEESIGIPYVWRCPGRIPAGSRHAQPIGLVDTMPTVLGLLGEAIPAGRDGVDRSEVLRGTRPMPADPVLLSHNTGAPPPERSPWRFPRESGRSWRGLRTSRWTYVCVDQAEESVFYADWKPQPFPATATRVLYDLEHDPFQIRPIWPGASAPMDQVMERLHADLRQRLERIGDDFLTRHWRPTRSATATTP